MSRNRIQKGPSCLRALVCLLGVILLAGICLADCGSGKETSTKLIRGATKLILATDLHYLSPDLTDGGWYFEQLNLQGDGKQLRYQQEILAAFVADMIVLEPDAVLLAGDLTYNGERLSHEALAELLRELTAAGIPVYVIPGNHDINNSYARSFFGEEAASVDSILPEDFPDIYRGAGYGSNSAEVTARVVSRSPDDQSYQVQFDSGISVYMLDTNRYRDGRQVGCAVSEETLDWLAEQLEQDQQAERVPLVVGHHNLLTHNVLYDAGYLLSNAEEVKSVLAEGGVSLYLSGHMHIQHEAAGQVVLADGSSVLLRDIAGSSLMVNPHQYGIITVGADGSIAYETKTVQVEAYAASQGREDPNLLDFASYAEEFYRENQERKLRERLAETDLTEEEIGMLADFAARLNVAYFAGMSEEEKQAFRDEEAYGLWQEVQERLGTAGLWYRYINSILG